MEKSIITGIKKILNMRAKRLFAMFSLYSLILSSILAQPVWNSGPTLSPFPIHLELLFNLDRASRVYFCVFPLNYNPFPAPDAAQVKFWSIQTLPFGSISDNGTIIYSGGAVGNNYNQQIYGSTPPVIVNQDYTVFVVAEEISTGIMNTPVRLFCHTPICPKIQLFTFFGNLGECVNIGAQGMFQAAPLGLLPTGVLKGTTWTVDWGDGSPVWNYTSTADNDLPPAQIHTFTSVTECAYQGTWVVKESM